MVIREQLVGGPKRELHNAEERASAEPDGVPVLVGGEDRPLLAHTVQRMGRSRIASRVGLSDTMTPRSRSSAIVGRFARRSFTCSSGLSSAT